MTREEATAFLYSIAGNLGFTDSENYTCKDGDKMREAIKVLNQEPCDDAISRQAVWDVMQELWGTSGELMDMLMALPPVTPAGKAGHWQDVQGLFFCSECDDGFGEVFHWNYCPNCGAKMEDGEK